VCKISRHPREGGGPVQDVLDSRFRGNDGVCRILFFVFCLLLSAFPLNAAAPKILLSSSSVLPGETLRVVVDGLEPNQKTRVSFANGFYPLFTIGPDAQRGLIGIRLGAPPGTYPLKFQQYVKRIGKWQTFSEQEVEVATKTYAIETVSFNTEKTSLMVNEHNESARIHKLLSELSPEQLWEGAFDPPVQGPVIGEFGLKRVRTAHYAAADVKNGVTAKEIDAGFHKGIDLRAAKGTPILASSSGVVLMAATLKAHGRTVLLNHGQGVMTIYLHMNSIAVTPGQKVVKSQMLGRVGSSGLSTAPHVHWGLYVHAVAVDPKPWTESEF
jgi:murein DD-endopeptidase MepM/ murein hydrolase activator NlpD